MTKNNNFKKQIRARMEQTGETYTEARKHLIDAFTACRPDAFYLNQGYLLGNPGPLSTLRTDQLFSETDTRALAQLLPERSRGGLIVFTGESNVGKTHTMNAVLNTYLTTNPENLVIGIENGSKEELETPEDSFYKALSLTGMYQRYFDDISELAYQTLRMTPNLIAITEPPARKNEFISFAEQASDTGHLALLELTSPSLAQTVRLLSNSKKLGFHNLNAIVEQQRFVFNSRNFFLRSVLVFDNEVKRIATEYTESLDEEKFYAQLRAHGVNPLPQPK